MSINILEYWRGREENRPMIGMGSWYGELNPEAFYLGANCDAEGDQVEPGDLDERDKVTVLAYDSPFEGPIERDLYVQGECGVLMEVLEVPVLPESSGEL